MPKFSPAGGFYKSAQNVTITTTVADAAIYYTTDGSTPTEQSAKYDGPVPVSSQCVIRAMAKADKEIHYGMTSFDFDLGTVADADSRQASPADWQKEVVYLAMIDRFSDGDSSNNKVGGVIEVENDPSKESNFSGGDFTGLINKMKSGYFTGHGITAIWITPPIRNQWYEGNYGGYHGYWASDFTQVDPHFGDIAQYREFVKLAHQNGIKVIQDIVVNHVGDYFKVSDTPYVYEGNNWSLVSTSKPTNAPEQFPWKLNDPGIFSQEELLYNSFYHWTPYISDYNDANQTYTYQSGSLDDMNTDNEVVQNLLRGYFRYWIDKVDIDGFRVDTVKYVQPEFFEGFVNSTEAGNMGVREYAKSLGKNDFILFGEAWSDSDTLCASYTQNGDGTKQRLDSMIYFPLNTAVRNVFASGGATNSITSVLNARYTSGYAYPDKLVTFVNNHDMGRISAQTSSSLNKAAYAFIMTIPGVPQVYYGDEQNLDVCREAMFAGGYQGPNLAATTADSFSTSSEMYNYIAGLISLRKANPVLSNGKVTVVRDSSSTGILAYRTVLGNGGVGNEAFVVMNTSDKKLAVTNMATGLTEGGVFDLQNPSVNAGESSFTVEAGGNLSLVVPAESCGIYLLSSVGAVPAPAANQIAITSTYGSVITDTSLTVSGTLTSVPADIVIFFDGDIDNALSYTLGALDSTAWSESIAIGMLGGGKHTVTAAVIDGTDYVFSETVPFTISAEMTVRASAEDPQGDDTGPAGYSYTIPTEETFAGHYEDILGVEVATAGPDMEVRVKMRDISSAWSPTVNMFDHVLFSIMLRKPKSLSTVTALPKFNYDIPFAWDYMVRESGWSATMFSSSGAGAKATGTAVKPAPPTSVDAVNNTVTFRISGSSVGTPSSYSGWKVYVATWDEDMGNPRGLTQTGGQWKFGGGDGTVDPLVIDESDVITIP